MVELNVGYRDICIQNAIIKNYLKGSWTPSSFRTLRKCHLRCVIMKQQSKTIIKDVRIFTGEDFIEDGFVCFSNGRILVVGQGRFQGDPHDAAVISRPGDTLIPGLINSHIHALGGNVMERLTSKCSTSLEIESACLFRHHRWITSQL